VCPSFHQGSILNFSYVSLRSSCRGMAANENFKISTLISLLALKDLSIVTKLDNSNINS